MPNQNEEVEETLRERVEILCKELENLIPHFKTLVPDLHYEVNEFKQINKSFLSQGARKEILGLGKAFDARFMKNITGIMYNSIEDAKIIYGFQDDAVSSAEFPHGENGRQRFEKLISDVESVFYEVVELAFKKEVPDSFLRSISQYLEKHKHTRGVLSDETFNTLDSVISNYCPSIYELPNEIKKFLDEPEIKKLLKEPGRPYWIMLCLSVYFQFFASMYNAIAAMIPLDIKVFAGGSAGVEVEGGVGIVKVWFAAVPVLVLLETLVTLVTTWVDMPD